MLNLWSTHQFWVGFFDALGIDARRLEFSSDSSEEQARQFGKGRGTVDCCYPVKCISGHYGELLARDKRHKIDVLFSPMIYSLPSYLNGHVLASLACPRVMAAPENIKAGFLKEKDVFAEHGVRYVAPLVSLGDAAARAEAALRRPARRAPRPDAQGDATRGRGRLSRARSLRRRSARASARKCSRDAQPQTRPACWCWRAPTTWTLASATRSRSICRPTAIRCSGRNTCRSTPTCSTGCSGPDIDAGHIKSPFDIADVWPSSYSANTNEILWAAKFAARMPWVACVVRLSSYECGMDQPTYTPVQQIVERSGTLFFSFQDLDSTKPAGSVKIRVETIAHYLQKYSAAIIEKKKAAASAGCPLL